MFAIVDLETTGGSPRRDRIMEIAMFIHDGEKVIDRYTTLINPHRDIVPRISRLTGITNEMVKDAPSFESVARDIVNLTEGKVIVAHNSQFDYTFLKNEFRSLGYTFQRKQLCTVRLSRQILPGLESYGLDNLCKALEIEIEDRHRAHGDAQATVELFDLLLAKDQERFIDYSLRDELKDSSLPQLISREQIDEIPDETGIYYFHSEDDSTLYVGKGNNIRQRVIQHFTDDSGSRRNQYIRDNLHHFSHQITGSELVALLLEAAEIKRTRPRYNRALTRTRDQYGLYLSTDPRGYQSLKIRKLRGKNARGEGSILTYPNYSRAQSELAQMLDKFELCQKLCGLYKSKGSCFHYQIHRCKGACIGEETKDDYNQKVEGALQALRYTYPNFFVIGEGREGVEKSLVWVDQGKYKGFGYFQPDCLEDGFERLDHWEPEVIEPGNVSPEMLTTFEKYITPYSDNRDTQRIIRSYLRRNKFDWVVQY